MLELHAIAKGWIADRATEAGLAVAGVEQFVVNLGGDLAMGAPARFVGIEDPATPWDNAPPLTVVEIANRGSRRVAPHGVASGWGRGGSDTCSTRGPVIPWSTSPRRA